MHAPAPHYVAAPASYPWAWVCSLIVAVLAGFLMGRSAVADWWMVAVAALVIIASGVGYAAGRRGGRP